MATNQRRRERYASDTDYRRARIQQAWDHRQKKRREAEHQRKLRGWSTIDSAPENEVITLYDPAVFWPVLGSWGGQDWKCVHYEGRIRPTHWRRNLPLPLA